MMDERPGGAVSCPIPIVQNEMYERHPAQPERKKVGTEHRITIDREDEISNIRKLSD